MGVLELSPVTREQLEKVVIRPESTRQLKRAQALLWVDEGEPISWVADRLRVTRQSIYNWIDTLYQRKGSVAERLEDAPRSGRPRTKSDRADQVVPQLLETDPREHGYRATGWTNRLLRDSLHRQYDVKVSRYTIQQAVKRAGYRWKRPRYVLSRRPKTWRQAKGGLKKGSKTVRGQYS
jgi:transposase